MARLLAFIHVSVKQRALQNDLESALPGVQVTAVGRIGDFERLLKDGSDAVLALPVVLTSFKLSATLRGQRAGSNEERYSLVGVGAPPEPTQVQSVGALNLLGRDGTNDFVKSLLGSGPKVERVSKFEDLLPLLQMQRADAVLLPSRLYPDMKNATKLGLSARELAKGVGLPAAAALTPSGASVLAALAKMPMSLSKLMGVDAWR